MKKSELRQLIKEEIKNVLSEALNKDMRQFGDDLMKKLKQAKFDVEFGINKTTNQEEIKKKIKENPKYIYLEVQLKDDFQSLVLFGSKELEKDITNILNKFQTSTDRGAEKIIKKGGMSSGPEIVKQVIGTLNPGDIYSWPIGTFGSFIAKQYLRSAKVTSRTKTTTDRGGADKITYSQGTTRSI